MKKLYTSLAFFAAVFSFCFAQTTIQQEIEGVTYNVDTLVSMQVGPGSQYTALKYYTDTKLINTYILEVEATNPYIKFESVLSNDSTVGRELVSGMATRKSKENYVYFAGTNADFFATTGYVGYPNHGCIVESVVGRPPANTPHFAFVDNEPFIDFMTFTGSTCTIGEQSRAINYVNSLERANNHLVIYNHLNGEYTHQNAEGVEVLVKLDEEESWKVNSTLKGKVVSIEDGKGNMHILPGHFVLSGNGTGAEFLRQAQENDEVEIYLGLNFVNLGGVPDVHTMVGGDRFIIQNGEISDTNWAELHPRTAMGYSQDKSKVYFCIVDGRGVSAGVTTVQLAYMMRYAGAYTALNLDGGGSSAMYIKEFGIMNKVSDGTERAVCNAIYAINTAPEDDEIKIIKSAVYSKTLPRYGAFLPMFYGYNQYETLINTDVSDVQLTCDEEIGYINENGIFVASGTGTGMIYADYKGATTAIVIEIDEDASPEIRLESVLVDKEHPYEIEIQAFINNSYVDMIPAVFNWTVEDPSICSVDADGVIRGLANGETTITGKLGEIELTQKVKVEIPVTHDYPIHTIESFSDADLSAITQIKNLKFSSPTLPTKIQYTYTSGGRSPFVQWQKAIPLYSIPSALKIVFNSGNATISEATLYLKTNEEINYTPVAYSEIEKGEDYAIELTMEDFLEDAEDRANYPVYTNGIKFALTASQHTNNGEYEIEIKEFSMIYDYITVGIENVEVLSWLRVYPNPATDGKIRIALDIISSDNIRVELFDLSGQLVRIADLGKCVGEEAEVPLEGLGSGSYLMKVFRDNHFDTVKIMID